MGVKTISANYSKADAAEDSIISAWGRAMQEEIDNEIMVNMMKMNGWTVVKLERFNDMKHPVDIKDWCTEIIGEGWTSFGTTFLFSESEHAEWFILRWC